LQVAGTEDDIMRHLLAASTLHGDSDFPHSLLNGPCQQPRWPVQEVIDNRGISYIQLCFLF
jgi:hypothetical protein